MFMRISCSFVAHHFSNRVKCCINVYANRLHNCRTSLFAQSQVLRYVCNNYHNIVIWHDLGLTNHWISFTIRRRDSPMFTVCSLCGIMLPQTPLQWKMTPPVENESDPLQWKMTPPRELETTSGNNSWPHRGNYVWWFVEVNTPPWELWRR